MGRDGRGVKAASESSIEISFMYKGVRCRERVPLKPTAANLNRAAQHRAAILHAIAAGTFDYRGSFPESKIAARFQEAEAEPGEMMPIGDWLDKWLDEQKLERKSSSYETYRKIVMGKLDPWFGKLALSEFKRKHMRDKLIGYPAGNKTLSNIQSVMRAALEAAVDAELIEVNPLSGYTYKKKKVVQVAEDEIDPFDRVEQSAILTALEGQGRNLIQFAFWTGLRTSELVALDWNDIDFLRGTVRVSKAQTQFSEGPEVPKTDAGRRDVKLLAMAAEALLAQKAHTYLKGEEVFQNPRTQERWIGDQPIRKTLWQWALKRAKVRYRYPYQTRHTYASMMLSSGEHPMWVAQQMGHADWSMIIRRYGRWMPDADQNAGARAEEVYGKKKGAAKLSGAP